MTRQRIVKSKHAISLVLSTTLLLGTISNASAQVPTVDKRMCSGLNCLPLIKHRTDEILEGINNIPGYLNTYLASVTKMADSWLETKDDANTIGNNLKPFTEYAGGVEAVLNYQIENTKNFSKDFLLAGSLNPSGDNNPNNQKLPDNANQLVYSIILGQPIDESKYPGLKNSNKTKEEKDKLAALLKKDITAFIKNLAGTTFVLKQPSAGNTNDEINYRTFYNILSANQSVNTFVLSSLYYQNSTDDMIKKLMDIASNQDWITKIGSEELGLVLRHILMYNTGMFMELNRIQQMMQQQIVLQAMNNSLQAVNYENNLAMFAKAPKQGGGVIIPR